MSDEESFLTRWSRRKRETEAVRREDAKAPAAEDAQDAKTADSKSAEAKAGESKAPEFDLSTLPSLDEIGPGTKVDVFLQKGVPLDVSRAALRRAWSSDPAIRDYIGLSENSWDFNATEGVPGFGPLEMTDDLKRMVAEMFTPPDTKGADVPVASSVPESETTALSANDSSDPAHGENVDSKSLHSESNENEVDEVASNNSVNNAASESKLQDSIVEKTASESASTSESTTKLTRRGHGGALPR
jgi:hypothetical protein